MKEFLKSKKGIISMSLLGGILFIAILVMVFCLPNDKNGGGVSGTDTKQVNQDEFTEDVSEGGMNLVGGNSNVGNTDKDSNGNSSSKTDGNSGDGDNSATDGNSGTENETNTEDKWGQVF